jgi:TatD DNase family protein
MSKKKRREIPCFEHPIFESHCHLDYLDSSELEATLEQAAAVGVTRIITIAVSIDNLDKVLDLTGQDPRIWGTQGIHPHEAENYSAATGAIIKQRMELPRILAVGEIGLDYYYDHADRAVQRQVFEQQLQIAADTGMPVVIHTREADEDTRSILQNFSELIRGNGVIHSFTSGIELAEYCLGQGFCLGFNGIATFNQAENVREVVAATPVEQILLETDAPYLTPVPYRGKPNAPCYLPFIAEKVAQVKNCEVEDLLKHAWQNSVQLFFPEETEL